MKVVIPGGSGYLGHTLAAHLAVRGDEVVVLGRNRGAGDGPARHVSWDATTLGDWVGELEGADAVVHLTGRRVDTRSTRRAVDELISSRVGPVALVGEALRQCATPPPIWVQSGSLAIFGHTGDAVVDERTTPSGIGPREMVTVCLAWERAFELATTDVARRVLLRIGIGIGGAGDPATARLATLVRLGLGGSVASGRQWVSWVGIDDIVDVIIRALDDPSMTGMYHVTSPNPITNAEMMATYRRLLGRRFGLPSPAFVARLGAPLLGTSATLALTGRRAQPTRLLDEGYTFRQPDFEPAADRALRSAGLLQLPRP